MKNRIRISQIATVILLLAARPCSWKLFFAGMVLAALGEALRFWAAGHLRKNKSLCVTGPYRLARHPLYAGSFLMAVGFALACTNPAHPWLTLALWAAVLGGFKFVYTRQVLSEEKTLAALFPAEYAGYSPKTPRFTPKLSELGAALADGNFSFLQAVHNKETTTLAGLALIGAAIALKLKMGI